MTARHSLSTDLQNMGQRFIFTTFYTEKKNSNLSAYIEFVFITEDPSGMRLCSHPSGFWRASTMTGGNCQRRPLENCRRENCKKLEQPRLLQQMCYWQMWNFPEVWTLEYVVVFFPLLSAIVFHSLYMYPFVLFLKWNSLCCPLASKWCPCPAAPMIYHSHIH